MDEVNLAELDYPMPDPAWNYSEVNFTVRHGVSSIRW